LTYLCAQKARRQASSPASLRSRQGVATQPAQVS
jgi:hypothetical protein